MGFAVGIEDCPLWTCNEGPRVKERRFSQSSPKLPCVCYALLTWDWKTHGTQGPKAKRMYRYDLICPGPQCLSMEIAPPNLMRELLFLCIQTREPPKLTLCFAFFLPPSLLAFHDNLVQRPHFLKHKTKDLPEAMMWAAGPGDRRLKVGQLIPVTPITLGMLLLLETKSHLSSGGSWGLGDTDPVHLTVSWPGGHADPTSASFTSPPRPSFFLQLPASLPSLAADSYPADFQWHIHSQAEFSCLHQDPRLLTGPNIAHTFWKRVGNYKPLFPKDFLLWRSCVCVCVCVCVC